MLFVHQLNACCDLLILPLSLCNNVSLHIARQVHRQRAPFRTLLLTGSPTATPDSTTPLFDDMLSLGGHDLLPRLLWCATAPVPSRLGVDAIEAR
jgi:hypothetical protein